MQLKYQLTILMIFFILGVGVGRMNYSVDDSDDSNTAIEQTEEKFVKNKVDFFNGIKDETNLNKKDLNDNARLIARDEVESFINNSETQHGVKQINNNINYSIKDYSEQVENLSVPDAKTILITIEESEFDELKAQFESESGYTEASAIYQSQLNQFLSLDDSSIALDNIECKSNLCALEMSVYDKKLWRETFTRMTQQPWWNSMAFTQDLSHSQNEQSKIKIVLQNFEQKNWNDNMLEGEGMVSLSDDGSEK